MPGSIEVLNQDVILFRRCPEGSVTAGTEADFEAEINLRLRNNSATDLDVRIKSLLLRSLGDPDPKSVDHGLIPIGAGATADWQRFRRSETFTYAVPGPAVVEARCIVAWSEDGTDLEETRGEVCAFRVTSA